MWSLLEEVFGVALLPSSVTSPSVGPEFDSVDTGASVCDVPEPDVPEPDGVCGGCRVCCPGGWAGRCSPATRCGSLRQRPRVDRG